MKPPEAPLKDMGVIVLAGGMGTRLGYPHPKGCYPFSCEKGKSLFQMLAEKCLAASKMAGKRLLLAFMTSPENDLETRKFFETHHRFGLDEDQLYFFTQNHLPLLDEANKPLEIMGASGNGEVFKMFVESGLYKIWEEKGIRHVNIIPIDNPLADPFDLKLLSSHLLLNNQVTIKCTLRNTPEEKVGILIPENESYRVVEYSEAPPEIKNARTPEGKLQYPLANLSLFLVSMPFILAMSKQDFPYHTAKKRLSSDANAPWVFKKETFIFDMLPFAKETSALIYPREDCFAPVKSKEGSDTVEIARQIVYRFEKKLFEQREKKPMPSYPFEVPADYYYS